MEEIFEIISCTEILMNNIKTYTTDQYTVCSAVNISYFYLQLASVSTKQLYGDMAFQGLPVGIELYSFNCTITCNYLVCFLQLSYVTLCSGVSTIVAELHVEGSRVWTVEVVAPHPQNRIGDY